MSGVADLATRMAQLNDGIQSLRGEVRDVSALKPMSTSYAMEQYTKRSKGINGGFSDFGQFARCVRAMCGGVSHVPDSTWFAKSKGMMDKWMGEVKIRNDSSDWGEKLKANSPTGMSEGFTGGDGGYLVPPEYASTILMRTYANDLLSRCTVLPVGGNSIKIPAIDETSRANGSRFGGVQAYWRREAASVTATKPKISDIDLSLDSLQLMVRTSQEVLEDTGGVLETLLTTVSSEELTFKTGDAIVNGDGAGKPLGIMESPAKIAVAKEAGQPAATINSKNIMKMWSRLHVSARANAVWLYDQSIEPELMSMTVGSAGANMVVWLPPGGLSGSQYGTMLGRPMLPVEFCQQLGTEGDIILVDLSQYLAAVKGGVQTAVSMHLYFDTNEMAFRFTLRMDGKPWWLTALTPKSGGPTQGPIVTLATRS